MGKVKGKHRLDKFYHLAKEQGYRSRAAFKLIQLDSKYNFLNSSRSVLDLCAAPGGWMQVAVQRVPVGSLVLGIDLFPIRPIRGAISVEEDITKPKCRATIKKILAENGCNSFDLVLHDGSPNVGGAWAQEATSQNSLVIDSVKLATEFLAPKGNFVTKVFRSQDYNAVLYCLRELFEKVEVTKPAASRSTSAEIFVLGFRYKAPAKVDPRLLDIKHLFQGVTEPQKVIDVLRGRKEKRHRGGYDDGAVLVRKTCSAADFVQSETPLQILGTVTSISFDDPASLPIKNHALTTEEAITLCEDLHAHGKSEFKQLMKWRMNVRKALSSIEKITSASFDADKEDKDAEEQNEDEKLLNEMQESINADERKKKRQKKLLAKRRAKFLPLFCTMEDASFLFAGIKFNKKKFAKDFERFKEKKENKDLGFEVSIIGNAKSEQEEGGRSSKKRKRKGVTGGSVEGFSVFRSSNPTSEIEQNDVAEDESSEKEVFRQLEWDNILRKKYGIHVSGSNVPSPLQSFDELKTRYKCKSYLLRNFAELGYVEPTPIQRQAIPVLLSGREFFACAPTGSGKTLAFVCPILMKLKHGLKNGIRAVILCPTRELAAQTTRECKKLAEGKKFYIKLMTKELARSADFSKLRCDILVSTPLRLEFAIRKRKLDLSRVEFLVLDESDKLFELGFVEQIDFVVKACSNPSVVRSLFSATLPDTVEDLARTLMHDAVRIIVGRKNTASQTIKQKLVFAGSEVGKLIALRQNFSESLDPPVLIFVQSIERAKELYKEFALTDIRVDVIHSRLPEVQRENAINDFRAGKTWVLIATDVAARGLDFKGLNCVINYDFPESASTYIHRIGRSGRAGREGEAITFYTEEDIPYLRNIANVMTQSGCEVPTWIMSMPKAKWKKHNPKRDSITAGPRDDDE